jgi:hypothetical protein
MIKEVPVSNERSDGTSHETTDGTTDGTSDGTSDGTPDGTPDGTSDGTIDGISDCNDVGDANEEQAQSRPPMGSSLFPVMA